jgi:hypothetical protein
MQSGSIVKFLSRNFSDEFIYSEINNPSGFLPLDDLPTGKNGVYSNQTVDLPLATRLTGSVRFLFTLIV